MTQVEGSRLYDRIMAKGFHAQFTEQSPAVVQDQKFLAQALKQTQVFNIQNVADYFWLHSGKQIEQWTERDYPRVAPPFFNFWMENRIPASYQISTHAPRALGTLNIAIDTEKYNNITLNLQGMRAEFPTARWLLHTTIFTEFAKSEPCATAARIFLGVNPDGTICNSTRQNSYAVGDLYHRCFDSERPSTERERRLFSSLFPMCYHPMLLALTFLNCKGVTLAEQKPDPGFSRVFQKRNKRPLVTFHTLNVEPMKTILKNEGQVDNVGLKRALHIVRGHFADYTDSGLFGRESSKGVYWREQHIRGSREQGLALKDYNINHPGNS